jgi:glycosyltransferase involved in cell wall biosynthesis
MDNLCHHQDTSFVSVSPVSPTVSVVTPFFNRREWLERCVETLENQSFRDFEAIVVDDGSTDGLADAIAGVHASFPLRYVRLERNSGGATARNVGIVAARGRYLALLDSDDSWREDKLSKQLAQFESAPDSDQLVGLSRQCVSDGKRSFVTPRRLITRGDRVGPYLFQCMGVIQSSMMFMTTELAKRVLFEDGQRGHEDWTFALRLEALGARFEMLPAPLTVYTDDPRSNRASLTSYKFDSPRIEWLERNRNLLGEHAYFAARAAFASRTRREDGVGSVRIILEGLTHGAVSPLRTAYYLGAWAFPTIRNLGVRLK